MQIDRSERVCSYRKQAHVILFRLPSCQSFPIVNHTERVIKIRGYHPLGMYFNSCPIFRRDKIPSFIRFLLGTYVGNLDPVVALFPNRLFGIRRFVFVLFEIESKLYDITTFREIVIWDNSKNLNEELGEIDEIYLIFR